MTEKEIEKLAELITDKLIAKQQEYDEQFHIDLQETMMKDGGFVRQVSEEELLLAEIASLGLAECMLCRKWREDSFKDKISV